MLLSSCKIGQVSKDFKDIKKEAQKISSDIKTVRRSFTPIDSATMMAISGVLTKLSDTISENQMDSIAARINRILVKYLNDSFNNLDPGPMGQHLVQGAMRPILDPATEQRLQEMIHSVSLKASQDLTAAMRNMMDELTSKKSKNQLNALVLSLFSRNNSDSLSGFINRSIANVDFELVGKRIATELLEQNLKPQVDSISRMAVRSIFEEIQKDKNARGFFSDVRNLIILGIGLLGVVMALLFWFNRQKAVEMNRMFIHAVEDLEGKHAVHARRAIENQARARGLLPNVDKMLQKENLKSLKDLDTAPPDPVDPAKPA
jgi:hypothetical protein